MTGYTGTNCIMVSFILVVIKYLIIFLAIVGVLFFMLDRTLRSPGWHGPKSDHFDGKKFFNIGKDNALRGTMSADFLKWVLNRPPNHWEWRDNASSSVPKQRVEGGELVVTMVNHASLLVQTEGLNILTDPIWSERTSPFAWIGPRRYRAPGIRFEDLPPIDLVIISHNHYDHMDIPTLKRLQDAFHPQVFAGIGNKEFLTDRGIARVDELDWWEKRTIKDGVNVSAVPAQHFSARAISDRDTTLWGGYVVETPHGNIYFAGDTGYGPFVGEIAKRYAAMRLSLLPIGAFEPVFFMSPVHVSPKEAFRMANELHTTTMIPMHYGTFRLADDGQDEPLDELTEAIAESPNATATVKVLLNGESTQIP